MLLLLFELGVAVFQLFVQTLDGGQRHAVYTLIGDALRLVPGISSKPNLPVQGELALTG